MNAKEMIESVVNGEPVDSMVGESELVESSSLMSKGFDYIHDVLSRYANDTNDVKKLRDISKAKRHLNEISMEIGKLSKKFGF